MRVLFLGGYFHGQIRDFDNPSDVLRLLAPRPADYLPRCTAAGELDLPPETTYRRTHRATFHEFERYGYEAVYTTSSYELMKAVP